MGSFDGVLNQSFQSPLAIETPDYNVKCMDLFDVAHPIDIEDVSFLHVTVVSKVKAEIAIDKVVSTKHKKSEASAQVSHPFTWLID